MEFRVLGSLEVHGEGGAVPLRGRRQPKLLAVLLLEAGHAVAFSRLVDTLWESDPPATARRQVQNTVSALCRELARAGFGEVVTAVGDGYRADVARDSLDAFRFEDLAARAREDRAAGRTADALGTFDEALSLWRGPAFAGLPGRHIEAGARRLEESRLGVIEESADLGLAAGDHVRLVGELRELLTEHPFRQRMIGQLMLALHRAGRTTEALGAYRDFRRTLADELGIDPGAELRRLHERILRADPELDLKPNAPAVAAAPPVPAQLPAASGTFAGRAGSLKTLDALLADVPGTAVLATIAGAAGVGKTTLAVRWAQRHRADFPDGQLFVDLRGYDTGEPVTPLEALARSLRALGAGPIPSDVDEAAALYRSALAGRKVLVVLDNARSVEQVRPLLPGAPGCLTLVTSRDDLRGLVVFDDARRVALDTLDPDEALALLTGILGPARVAGEPSAARRLARLCGYLPLALRIVAAELAGFPHRTLADAATRLDAHDRLVLLSVDGDPHATVAAAFDLSCTTLDAPAQALFRILGLIPGPDFSAALAAALIDRPVAETERVLTRLVTAHLVEQHRAGRYRFHDLLRLYAAQRCERDDSREARDAAVERMIAWYAEIPEQSDEEEHAGRVAALTRLPTRPLSWRMALRMSRLANQGHRVTEAHRCVELGLAAATAFDDTAGRAAMHSQLAVTNWVRGEQNAGLEHGRKARELARAVGDRRLEGVVMCNMGLIHRNRNDLETAENLMVRSLAIARELDDPEHIRTRRINSGLIYIGLARYDEAEVILTAALETRDYFAARADESAVRQALAKLYFHCGRFGAALRHAGLAVKLARDAAMPRREALALGVRADALQGLGRLDEARADVQAAFAMSHRAGLVTLANDFRLQLALVECELGEHELARERVLDILRLPGVNGRGTHAAARHNLACVHLATGEHAEALDEAARANEVYAEIGDRRGTARSLRLMGDACRGLGRAAEAAVHWTAALEISAGIGLPMAEELRERLAGRPSSRGTPTA